MILKVESCSGPLGEQQPHAFLLGGQRVTVVEIVDRWLSWEYSYFKVKTDDGATYIIRRDEHSGQWELTLFQAGFSLPK